MLVGSVSLHVEGVEDTKIKQQQYKGKDERGESTWPFSRVEWIFTNIFTDGEECQNVLFES